ncbi:hypothetical protein FQN57_005332 [Myotisia sp. PD_48]|nr:hypothetical protein FQN57_005332 [Myotisia sp. PD_48]
MGMVDSDLVFFHADLGPGNVIVSPNSGTVGIIGWGIAGRAPRGWVRAKFRLSSGLDFDQGITKNTLCEDPTPSSMEKKRPETAVKMTGNLVPTPEAS